MCVRTRMLVWRIKRTSTITVVGLLGSVSFFKERTTKISAYYLKITNMLCLYRSVLTIAVDIKSRSRFKNTTSARLHIRARVLARDPTIYDNNVLTFISINTFLCIGLMLMLILTMTKNVDSQDDFYFTKWPQSPSGSFALFYPTAACNFLTQIKIVCDTQVYYGRARAYVSIVGFRPKIASASVGHWTERRC